MFVNNHGNGEKLTSPTRIGFWARHMLNSAARSLGLRLDTLDFGSLNGNVINLPSKICRADKWVAGEKPRHRCRAGKIGCAAPSKLVV